MNENLSLETASMALGVSFKTKVLEKCDCRIGNTVNAPRSVAPGSIRRSGR